jgi:hypothetical protein
MASYSISFLICIIQMYTRSPPFKGLGNDMQIIIAVSIDGRRPEHPDESVHPMEEELWALITRCWEADPQVRPHIRRAAEKVSDWLLQ